MLELSPFLELGSFGLLAVLVLRFAARIERALDLHTRVVAELVTVLARSGVRVPGESRNSDDVLAGARARSAERNNTR